MERLLRIGGRGSEETARYSWMIDENTGPLFGEREVESLCKHFQIVSPRVVLHAYREYKESNGQQISNELNNLFKCNAIPISSAECEQGFSRMNLMCTSSRTSLNIKTISTLLFLCLVGPPLCKFKLETYVKSWIAKGH